MTGVPRMLRVLVKVLRHEGPAAVRDRLVDALEAARAERRAPWHEASDEPVGNAAPAPCTLNLSPVPPFPRRGGAQLQMLDRLRQELHHRSVALLYPTPGDWRLELRHGSELHRWRISVDRPGDALHSTAAAVGVALRITRARSVHLENPAAVPLPEIESLAAGSSPVLVSLHDFSCFCRRPHLIEAGNNGFCSFCTDDARCRLCLLAHGEAPPHDQTAYRSVFSRLLAAAVAVVFPSQVHLDTHRELFPGLLAAGKAAVIHPATASHPLPQRPARRRPHLALLGGLKEHKGGEVAVGTVEILRRQQPLLRITSFGDGDPHLLRRARESGVHIRGYYRAGTLPALLCAAGVSAAVLPSIWPESYGLVVDECLRAGIPVVAFDLGAVGPRIRRLGAGCVADPTSGPHGLAEAVARTLSAPDRLPTTVADALPSPAASARSMLALYDRLGLI